MAQSICTADECDRPAEAKTLCHKHYKRTRPRTPDKNETVQCDACSVTYERRKRATDRWTNSFCSYLCRDYHLRGGARVSKIPSDHIIYHFDKWCDWVPPFKRSEIGCSWCGTKLITSNRQHSYCSDTCKRRAKGVRRRAREFNATGTFTWVEITRLWISSGRACAYCHKATSLDQIQAEHVVPLSRGGANNLTNLLPSCAACNSDKRDLLLHEWNPDRIRRQLKPVKTTWGDHDQRYSHLVLEGRLLAA